MTNLLRLVACLFSIVSLNAQSTTVVLEWSGTIEEIVIDEGNNHFSGANIGETFSGTISYDSISYLEFPLGPLQSSFLLISESNSDLVISIINNGGCIDSPPISCNTFSNVFETTITKDSTLDSWVLSSSQNEFEIPLDLIFFSNSESILSDNSFQELPPFALYESTENKRAIFFLSYGSPGPGAWGYLDQAIFSEVPLPAGIYLFLSGLIGLVGVKLRGRNA